MAGDLKGPSYFFQALEFIDHGADFLLFMDIASSYDYIHGTFIFIATVFMAPSYS